MERTHCRRTFSAHDDKIPESTLPTSTPTSPKIAAVTLHTSLLKSYWFRMTITGGERLTAHVGGGTGPEGQSPGVRAGGDVGRVWAESRAHAAGGRPGTGAERQAVSVRGAPVPVVRRGVSGVVLRSGTRSLSGTGPTDRPHTA